MLRTDYDELCRHKKPKEMEKNLETRPAWCFKETPCPRGENESVPCSDCKCADEEVLVCAEMGWKIERVRE